MKLKKIAAFDNYILANLTLGMLQNSGIVCSLQDENTVLADPLLSNAIGGIKLMVAENQEQEALAIIREAENNYLKEIPCLKCRTYNLEIEEVRNEPTTIWGQIKNRLLFGQVNIYTKKYRCGECNILYDTMPFDLTV